MPSSADIFISYASDLQPMAEELTNALESQGLAPWSDFKDLRPGDNLQVEIEKALGEAKWVLILVGSDRRVSRRVEAEWSAALAAAWADPEKRLLPIVFGPEEPPPFLRNWVALQVSPGTETATWTRQVIDVLRNRRTDAGAARQRREERRMRLEEIAHAVEALPEGPADAPPRAPEPLR